MEPKRQVIAIAQGTYGSDSGDTIPEGYEAELRHVDAGDLNQLASLIDCAALIVGLQPLQLPQLRSLPPSIKVIGRAGIGLDSIDLEAAGNLGIGVVHQPSYATDEVADHATAMIMALMRQIIPGNQLARTDWPGWEHYSGVPSIGECTLGLVGYGRIGAAVADRMRPLVGRIIAIDPLATHSPDGVELVDDLESLLRVSDIVSLHAPMSEATAKLMNAETIAMMRPGSYLVNVSRGGLVDEDALASALTSGHLGGAGLDVLSSEPPSANNPMLTAPRTVLSPHAAWLSSSSQNRLQNWTLVDVLDIVRGRMPRNGRLAVRGARCGQLTDWKE